MRDILFKAKRKDNGEWVEGNLIIRHYDIAGEKEDQYIIEDIIYGIDEQGFAEFQSGVSEDVDPNTVCEYTGFTDKNGVKIFEGDILENEGLGATLEVFYGEIIGHGNGFQWRPIIGRIFESMTGFCDEYTIVGNRFDNPELLNP